MKGGDEMPRFPKFGAKVIAKVLEAKDCTIGLKEGEEYEVSVHHCGEFCGAFYHSAYNLITLLQFGGAFPLSRDPDRIVWECPNFQRRVKVEFRRIKD